MSLWTNEKFMRNGADITIAVGDPDDVKLLAYENGIHYLPTFALETHHLVV